MSDVDRRFHETWLGMVQPTLGLVVSVPVLVDAQCMERQPPSMQERLVTLCPPAQQGEAGAEPSADERSYRVADLSRLLHEVLGFSPSAFDAGDALPKELSLYVPEGKQTITPTLGLRKLEAPMSTEGALALPASKAGARYELLIWDLGVLPGGSGVAAPRRRVEGQIVYAGPRLRSAAAGSGSSRAIAFTIRSRQQSQYRPSPRASMRPTARR